MRLSDAIVCGSVMGKMKEGDIGHCALGVAANAVGIKSYPAHKSIARYWEILAQWPWLESNAEWRAQEIMQLFDQKVCKGLMTLDQLVAYVRQIEPSCPDCCSFDCCCSRGEYLLEQMAIASFAAHDRVQSEGLGILG